MTPVTKTFLPPIREYQDILKRAWNKQWITNRGDLVIELEDKLKLYLGLKDFMVLNMCNGTIPLQIALKCLGKGGEIITTPFSYVATASTILWENCTPVFVDIDSEYLTINEKLIESSITERTTCILATHVFGNPCNVLEIEKIAKKYNLSVIYDAAHCFGVKYCDKSIFEFGNISTCSFHATKIFHTGEGGALFCNDLTLKRQAYLYHTFGHIGDNYYQNGINAKMSELSAAMGLAVLPYMEKILLQRKRNFELYNNLIKEPLFGIRIREKTEWNYSYIPCLLDTEEELTIKLKELSEQNIFPRRYFYPSLNLLPHFKSHNICPVSVDISKRILCLPNYQELSEQTIYSIATILNK
jgi:dTDP-4-amino-4,6-dideoxygalactose transaminase